MNHIIIIVSGVLLGCAASVPKQALWEPPASKVDPLSIEQLSSNTSYQEVINVINDRSISCDSLLDLHLNYSKRLLSAAFWYNKRSRQKPVDVAFETLENKVAAIAIYGAEKWKENPDPEELYSWVGPRLLREQVAALKGILEIGFQVLDSDCGIDSISLKAITYGNHKAIRQAQQED